MSWPRSGHVPPAWLSSDSRAVAPNERPSSVRERKRKRGGEGEERCGNRVCRAHARIPAIVVRLFSREQTQKTIFPPLLSYHILVLIYILVRSIVPSNKRYSRLPFSRPIRSFDAFEWFTCRGHVSFFLLPPRVHRSFPSPSLLPSPPRVIELLFVMTGNCCAPLHTKYIISGFPAFSGFLGNVRGPTRVHRMFTRPCEFPFDRTFFFFF